MNDVSPAVRYSVIGVVALVWAANYTAPIVIKDYVPNEQLNIAFMTIIGLLFNLKKKPTAETTEKSKDGNEPTKDKEG